MARATDSISIKLPQTSAGHRYARLVAICEQPSVRGGGLGRMRKMWSFRCDCGLEIVAQLENVRCGNTRSCGCLQMEAMSRTGKASRTHGMSRTGVYGIWGGIIDRCTNPTSKDYPNYGGRGIQVCERWRQPENFIADMGDRPPGAQIERKDNSGPYSPENCIWASHKTQSRNRRSTHYVTLNGRVMSLAEACELVGTSYSAVKERLRIGWDEHRAIWTPLRADSRRISKPVL